ncbi:RAMP superfamily CRISPR-associated protein [Paenibacillus ginsengihumi]|uniref:RAMP superfamily CRISPR-associated protein n=1 Tax=Paenibacillus ginsengihumi TaxID=431596 RepID=UPI0003669A7B|nr:RAMP superfamily CRISPR-associated protein [Paenibacillus ginsengihumi]
MIARIVYTFTIKAVTPIHFGDGDGQMVQNFKGQCFLPGTSIGGALRECLIQAGLPEELIRKYMGGVEKVDNKEVFVTSRLFISDGKLEGNYTFHTEEGTAIDRAYGTAASHLKYKYDYVDGQPHISFRIECDISEGNGEALHQKELERLIDVWATGIGRGIVRFGGKKNLDFGRFSLIGIERIVHPLDNAESLDMYIFNRHNRKGESYHPGALDPDPFEAHSETVFRLQGSFPYGVYQSYDVQDEAASDSLTGVRRNSRGYYLPASSIKGLLRSEVELLILRMTGSRDVAKMKCCELFGSSDGAGKLSFSPLQIDEAAEVKVKRCPFKNNDNKTVSKRPVYIKIDRLTGGAYSSALKEQKEIQGNGVLEFRLKTTVDLDGNSPYFFPLIYALRRIGSGKVPLGGRTVIGLGQFMASETVVSGKGWSETIENDGELPESQILRLKQQFELFERWCHAE